MILNLLSQPLISPHYLIDRPLQAIFLTVFRFFATTLGDRLHDANADFTNDSWILIFLLENVFLDS
ncbi:hypothetical protein [Calothrix sp. NIES-2098]|uniref:hypothetical protein n=1 Tax=Calothrix sp. NIES-2098 TaxID=1954171 RepID=UPI00403FFCF7